MQRHTSKINFDFISITVMALEVAALIVFGFGATVAIFGAYKQVFSANEIILFGFGGVVVSFLLLVAAEFLQLLMKIEHNTRRHDSIVARVLASKHKKKK